MYANNPLFKSPADINTKIWRYLDFTKFVALLDKQALFFARSDKLVDKFEGSYTKSTMERYYPSSDPALEESEKLAHFYKSLASEKRMRKYFLINSWHMNEYESAAMWELYLKSNEGVAIQSTFNNLKESFDSDTKDHVNIGEINYIDYEKDSIPMSNVFHPFLCKRKSFEHEKELRAIVWELPFVTEEDELIKLDLERELYEMGKYVPVSLEILIEKIFVSPTAPPWFNDLVQSVVNKYELKKEIIQSSLAEDPLY
jgi:hypothetical protein